MKSFQAKSSGMLLVQPSGLERIDRLMRDESFDCRLAALLEKQRCHRKLVERPPTTGVGATVDGEAILGRHDRLESLDIPRLGRISTHF